MRCKEVRNCDAGMNKKTRQYWEYSLEMAAATALKQQRQLLQRTPPQIKRVKTWLHNHVAC